MSISDLSLLRLFVVESANPIDVLQGRSEAPALNTIGSLIGHEVATISVHSRQQFIDACKWIASISKRPEQQSIPGRKRKKRYDAPLCVHISAHGNDEGIAVADELISWKDLVADIGPICKNMDDYYGDVVFIISACGAGEQKLTRELSKLERTGDLMDIPVYLFVTADPVIEWQDAAVAWTVFYHQLKTAEFDDKKSIQKVLDRVILSCGVCIRYYRWDSKTKKYKKWETKMVY